MSSYVNIQTEWLTTWRLTADEAVVYGYLHGWLVDRGDKAMPFRQTQAAMASVLGMPERKFKRLLARLVAYGCVTVIHEGAAVGYRLHARMIYNEGVTKLTPSVKIDTECQNCHPESDKIDTDGVTILTPIHINHINNHDINTRENAHARAREDGEKEGEADAAEEARKAAEEARKREAEERREYEAKQVQKVGVDELTRELRQEVEGGSQLSESLTRLYGLDRRQQMEYVGWFLDTLRVQGVQFKVRSDYRKHFLSWLNRKMIDKQKNMTKDEQRIDRNKKLFADLL